MRTLTTISLHSFQSSKSWWVRVTGRNCPSCALVLPTSAHLARTRLEHPVTRYPRVTPHAEHRTCYPYPPRPASCAEADVPGR